MITKIKSATIIGIEAFPITVEVDAAMGLPSENIVGLPDTVIRESKSRIKSALKNSNFTYPVKAYTINLAPADLPKEGSFFDLPIAIGMLSSTKQLNIQENDMFIGELSLNGDINPIKGIISICHLAAQKKIKRLFLPKSNLHEASLIKGISLIGLSHLSEVSNYPNIPPQKIEIKPKSKKKKTNLLIEDVKGQSTAKRALQIAATGFHNLLFIGPPGCGKSMLINRLPYLLPDLTEKDAITIFKIKSISTPFNSSTNFNYERPFRTPHHSTSYAGMVGGGKKPRPGEISLAHNGILFLDELPEFNRNVIEVLRQPLEEKKITISRATQTIDYPANFLLAAAMNPCPCGYYKDSVNECTCQPSAIKKYWKKISGPILDRFDLILTLPKLKQEDYLNETNSISSATLISEIDKAIYFQLEKRSQSLSNSNIEQDEISKFCKIPNEAKEFLANGIEKGLITGRSHDKILKVARSIADLEKTKLIETKHILEALQFRKFSLQKLLSDI